MYAGPSGRWPPIYDAAELAAEIKRLGSHGRLIDAYFSPAPQDGSWCQGDIISLDCDLPIIDTNCVPAVLSALGIKNWLLLSNTCDLSRSLDRCPWVQLIPLFDIDANATELTALRAYRYTRRFYDLDWNAARDARHYVAELTMPVTMSREALRHTKLQAHLCFVSWVLLHSCLVRFLARDDRRFYEDVELGAHPSATDGEKPP